MVIGKAPGVLMIHGQVWICDLRACVCLCVRIMRGYMLTCMALFENSYRMYICKCTLNVFHRKMKYSDMNENRYEDHHLTFALRLSPFLRVMLKICL